MKLYRRVSWGFLWGVLMKENLFSSVLQLLFSKEVPRCGFQFTRCSLCGEEEQIVPIMDAPESCISGLAGNVLGHMLLKNSPWGTQTFLKLCFIKF